MQTAKGQIIIASSAKSGELGYRELPRSVGNVRCGFNQLWSFVNTVPQRDNVKRGKVTQMRFCLIKSKTSQACDLISRLFDTAAVGKM